MIRSVFLSLLGAIIMGGQYVAAEGLVFAPEVQCDFEVTESYFLLGYEGGRLAVVPTLSVPVRGRGDNALVGGATWIIGGMLPEPHKPDGSLEKLVKIRVVLRGAETLIKVVPVPVPIDEDLQTLRAASEETASLLKSRGEELERSEGRVVQAQAELERMRSQVDDISDLDKLVELRGSAIQRERALARMKKSVESLAGRYEKLKKHMQYQFGDIVQAVYEEAARNFRAESDAIAKRNAARVSKEGISLEDQQRFIQLGRSFNPEQLQERLELIRSKTRAFESRLRALGIEIDPRPKAPQPKPPAAHSPEPQTEQTSSAETPNQGEPDDAE